MVNRLVEMYEKYGQSPWIDNLSRAWINSGRITELKDLGIRGLTSNSTIFANAIAKSDDYDKEFLELIKTTDTKTAYWQMACEDVASAADSLSEIYSNSKGTDGFVSIEVDPELAHDTNGTISAAKSLWDKIAKENLMIKVPATREGLPAITEVLSMGISVNVTLIFGLERYREVMEAHIAGISQARQAGHKLSGISSVASFFVSRVDTKLDPILSNLPNEGKALAGKVAVAQAQAAYVLNQKRYSQKDWMELAQSGALVQRPLWASTSTKNPNYPDLLYVENLIAPGTVNTMPEATVLAYLDHGRPVANPDDFEEHSAAIFSKLKDAGVDLSKASEELEAEGVASFANSFKELLAALETKRSSL